MALASAFGNILDECRYTVRRWVRSPVFAVGILGTLGIGLGATALMSEVLEALLLKAPPYIESPELVGRVFIQHSDPFSGSSLSPESDYPTFRDLQSSGVFDDVAGSVTSILPVGQGRSVVPANVALVTPRYFAVMGTHAALGRVFVGRRGSSNLVERAVVLSMGFWRRDFGGDLSVIGRQIRIARQTYTVTGIAPDGFSGLESHVVDAWLPLEAAEPGTLPSHWGSERGSIWLSLAVRLRRGISRDLAGKRASVLLRKDLRAAGMADTLVSVLVASPIIGQAPDRPKEVQIALWIGGGRPATHCVGRG